MNISSFKNESQVLTMYPLQYRSPSEVTAETFIGCVLFLLGLVGNGLVCYVIHKKRFTNSSMYFFMLNLAYADLLVCTVSIPLTLLSTRPQPLVVKFGSIPCKVIRFIQYILPPASVAILTATAIDRYFHICVPLKKMITTNATKQLAAICWGSAFILTLPIFYLIETQKVMYEGSVYEFCNIEETSTYPIAGMIYLVIRGCLGFAIPLAMVSVLYFRIVRTVWQRRTRHRSANRQRANIVKSLLTVVIAFSLSWAPFSISNKYYLFMKPKRDVITRAEIICFWIGLTASVYNPLIYAFYNKKFRNAFVSVVFKKRRAQMPNATLKPAEVSYRPRSRTLPAVLAQDSCEEDPKRDPTILPDTGSNKRKIKTRHLSLEFDILEEKRTSKCSCTLFGVTNLSYNESENSLAMNKQCIPHDWTGLLDGSKQHVKPGITDITEPAVTRNNYSSACAKEDVFYSRVVIVEPKGNLSRRGFQRKIKNDSLSRTLSQYPILKRSQTLTERKDSYYEQVENQKESPHNNADNTPSMKKRELDFQNNRKYSRSKSFHLPSSYNLCR